MYGPEFKAEGMSRYILAVKLKQVVGKILPASNLWDVCRSQRIAKTFAKPLIF